MFKYTLDMITYIIDTFYDFSELRKKNNPIDWNIVVRNISFIPTCAICLGVACLFETAYLYYVADGFHYRTYALIEKFTAFYSEYHILYMLLKVFLIVLFFVIAFSFYVTCNENNFHVPLIILNGIIVVFIIIMLILILAFDIFAIITRYFIYDSFFLNFIVLAFITATIISMFARIVTWIFPSFINLGKVIYKTVNNSSVKTKYIAFPLLSLTCFLIMNSYIYFL